VDFEFLHPAADEAWPDNDGSCVLRVSAGEHAILLTGDIERNAEEWLLAEQPDKLRADLVVVPHHGSRSSSSDAFVAAVRPRYALVSAGWRNRWGFPKDDVMQRYEQVEAEVAVTGESGALLARLSSERGVESLRRWRRESRAFWNFP
jgi:competence protein ComEC